MDDLEHVPFLKGLTLYYAYLERDDAVPGLSQMVWRIEHVSGSGRDRTAAATRRWGDAAPVTQTLHQTPQGLFIDGILEIKYPVVEGDSWRVEGDAMPLRSILSVDAEALTMVKTFPGCLELGFTNEDTDSGSRLYAPGVGLVREQCSGEGNNGILSLIHWVVPRA